MTVIDRPRAQAAESAAAPATARLDWVDNVRTATILLVVNMHACVTYSYVGSWYYNAPPEPSTMQKLPFVFWQAHLQSFFMGLMFFLAGYYADRSLARRGRAGFAVERLKRLGIPTLIYMLVIHPLVVIGMHPGYAASSTPVADYVRFVTLGHFIGSSGPMWFAFALLLFSLAFAAIGSGVRAEGQGVPAVKPWVVVGLGAGLAVASFLVRTVQPVGTSILNFQLCYFAQYVAAFALGVWISRRDGLAAFATSPVARRVGIAGLVLGPIGLAAVCVASLPAVKAGSQPFNGGWNGIALGMAFWEQMTGVALGIGFMALIALKGNVRTKLSAWLADRSFAVYMLHTPILVALALLVQPVRSNPYVMAVVLTAVGIAASFLIADVAKRIPLLKNVL